MHKNDIIHRDLKLENVLCKTNPKNDKIPICTIADFGMCTIEETPDKSLGTDGWMAPEVEYLSYGEKYNNKADVYGLGLIFLILLTGKHPFKVKNEQERFRLKPVFEKLKRSSEFLF